MGLKDVLAKMKLVELEGAAHPAARPPSRGPAPPPPPAAARPKPAASPAPKEETIEDILASLPAQPPKIEPAAVPPAQRPGARDADFSAVYEAARVPKPPHGFTAHELLKMLATPQLASLDEKARAQALAAFLEMNPAGRVSIRDVIEDAVRRDQALDAYERALTESLAKREADVAAQNAALQAEIDELARRNQQKMRANQQDLEAEKARILEWRYAKIQEERRLFDAVAPFVESNPVSLGGGGEAPAPPQGA